MTNSLIFCTDLRVALAERDRAFVHRSFQTYQRPR